MSWRGVPIEGLVWIASTLSKRGPGPLAKAPKEILVIRPSDLGDLLTTTPVFEALRNRFPSTRIVAGVGSWGRQIVENNPFIDEIVELDAPWNNKVLKKQAWTDILKFIFESDQVSALRKQDGFDVGIDILGSHVGSFLMMRLGARYRIGVRGYRGGWSACDRYINFTRSVHVARAALAQAELLGATELPEARPQLYITEAERCEATRIWNDTTSKGAKRILVGCGGGFEEKCWPAESFGETLRILSSESLLPSENPNFILVGGPADQPRAERVIAGGASGVRSYCGKATLRITFALAEQADLVLTNASMLFHAAAAFHRPTVVVLGGVHTDIPEHDRLWGYPPPYSSVGPDADERWPSPEKVAEAIRNALGMSIPHVLADSMVSRSTEAFQ
jgi:ADP-heptose:LPS heptosyltransferase